MNKTDNTQEEISEELFRTAPAKLAEFLANEKIVPDLLRYDEIYKKFRYPEYGMENARQAKKLFRQLGDAWAAFASVSVDLNNPHRCDVRVKII